MQFNYLLSQGLYFIILRELGTHVFDRFIAKDFVLHNFGDWLICQFGKYVDGVSGTSSHLAVIGIKWREKRHWTLPRAPVVRTKDPIIIGVLKLTGHHQLHQEFFLDFVFKLKRKVSKEQRQNITHP